MDMDCILLPNKDSVQLEGELAGGDVLMHLLPLLLVVKVMGLRDNTSVA